MKQVKESSPPAMAGTTRIMIVDDSPTIRRYLRWVLEQNEGWQVCDESINGKEAVDRFNDVQPDLIVLDFQMPEMDGLAAARILVKISPKTPILLFTLYLSAQLSAAARDAGIRGVCSKNEMHTVANAVGALLRNETYFIS